MSDLLHELAHMNRFGMKPGLTAIRKVLRKLGNPQTTVRAIHIAGTNGKGAVAATLDAVLRANGRSVGRYTSPHLVNLNERFFLQGQPMPMTTLESAAQPILKESLTYFEALTAMAFRVYAEVQCDYTILETGLGGRLDATNVCQPELTIITRIGLDHCDWLGSTVTAIAQEKAGILKKGVPVVLGANTPEVQAVVKAQADKVGAPYYYAPDLVQQKEIPTNLSLKGSFNRENTQTALAALKVLHEPSPRAAFAQVVWPGRFQQVGQILIDGAHNPPAARALAAALGTGRYTLIAGFCGDKDVDETLRILAPHISTAFAVPTNNPRSLPPDRLAAKMKAVGISAKACSSLAAALRAVARKKNVLVCGSLFLAGEALVQLKAYPWGKERFDMAEKLKPSLALVSLGCAKNAVDLQVKAGNLLKEGYVLSSDPDRADVVIVNTCSFIASAREEAEAEITRALELKARGQYGKVVVTGCYPQRYPKAKARFPGVDSWEGVPQTWIEPKLPAFRFTGQAFAYLKIAEGCAHRCAYCAIPNIRGKYRSRPMADILKEAKALLKSGCRELNIVAQDPMLYGIDVKDQKITLTDLLWKLDALKGDFWVRVLYSYPNEITEEFLDWLNTAKHAVKYVDVPIQHTVPEVLANMNRTPAIEASLVAAEALRAAVPGITLRTTILTGFPGETAARFQTLLADLRRMQFDHLGAFAYSPEEGTKGAKFKTRPARKVAEAREKQVMQEAEKLWRVKSARLLGQTFPALVVAPGVARLPSQAPDVDGVVYLLDSAKARQTAVGDFIRVRLESVCGFDFEGEVV